MKGQTISRLVLLSSLGLTGWLGAAAQQGYGSFRKFVRNEDTSEFKDSRPAGDGPVRSYETTVLQVYDLDADSTTYTTNRQQALLYVEGQLRNGRKDGLFTCYLIDNNDHSKRYKVWEQTFQNDKLNGEWRTYTLRGGLVKFQTYRNDSLNGVSRTYWIDGKSIMDETEYVNGQNKFIQRTYYKNGKIETEMPYDHGKSSGTIRRYYETGTIEETQEVKNGRADGVRKNYYPNGQLSTEQVFKAGKNWEMRSSFTPQGKRRKAGTLRNGNGTIIFYNEDGSVKEVKSYVNGVVKS